MRRHSRARRWTASAMAVRERHTLHGADQAECASDACGTRLQPCGQHTNMGSAAAAKCVQEVFQFCVSIDYLISLRVSAWHSVCSCTHPCTLALCVSMSQHAAPCPQTQHTPPLTLSPSLSLPVLSMLHAQSRSAAECPSNASGAASWSSCRFWLPRMLQPVQSGHSSP